MARPSAPKKPVARVAIVESFDDMCDDEERDLARLEPAWGKAARFFRTGCRLGHQTGSIRCMSLLKVHRVLEVYRRRLTSGDTLSLLHAISTCAEENLPLPTWLADAFQSQMTEFLTPGRSRSLDEVFRSKSLPTNSAKKAAAARQDWQLGARLCHDAWELAQKDKTLTSFDRIVARLLKGTDYGVAKTKAKELIIMIETSQSQFLDKELSLSRFLEKRRKVQT
jgi:hypothetical protein